MIQKVFRVLAQNFQAQKSIDPVILRSPVSTFSLFSGFVRQTTATVSENTSMIIRPSHGQNPISEIGKNRFFSHPTSAYGHTKTDFGVTTLSPFSLLSLGVHYNLLHSVMCVFPTQEMLFTAQLFSSQLQSTLILIDITKVSARKRGRRFHTL